MSEKKKYCCDRFRKQIEDPQVVYGRRTTFRDVGDGWVTDFSDGEYGDIDLEYCPFCGSKLIS